MVLDRSFFESEVRDGFYVTSEMKQAWAAQLEVLNDFDKACSENGIQYFAEWGTLLGAVRHHGFIPWDDDMDICMKRPDYDRFLKMAEQIMPKNYKVFTLNSDENNNNMVSRIINTDTISFEEEHLKKYHGFPYIAGIDIFPLDFIARNEEDDAAQSEIIKIISSVMNFINKVKSSGLELNEDNTARLNEQICQIESICGVKINREGNVSQQLNMLIDRVCGLYREYESDYLTLMILWVKDRKYQFPKEYYEKSVRLPFENITIPVPYAYDAILKKKYGDYMKLVHTWDSHEYPFYESQKEVLKNIGVQFNEFRESYDDYLKYKQQIIDLRNMKAVLKRTSEKNSKKTVVFMPFKASNWNMMDGLWREYSSDNNVNVIVIPIPYYYKNADGTAERFIEDIEYPDYINIVPMEEYDITKENPNEIIIQNPYDGYDIATSVSPDCYVKKLAIHTDKLTYIPYFETEEISTQDMRAYKNMDSYVIMPGVVYADRVIVQSEGIKDLYVKKLTQFYGEESRTEWKGKIQGNGAEYIKKKNPILRYNLIPPEWKSNALKADGSYKKIILYYITTNSVIEHGHKMFEKIGHSMEIFREYDSEVMPLLAFESNLKEMIEQGDATLHTAYCETIRRYQDFIVEPHCLKEAENICDAFYGEAGAEAQHCRNAGKPVMIQDVEYS